MRCTQPIHRSAQVAPNKTATIFGERTRTFREIRSRISRLAGALRSIGLSEGDRVAILALNSDRYYEYFFAVPWAGGVIVPLNIRWSLAENINALMDSGASVLFVDDAYLSLVADIQTETDTVTGYVYMGEGDTPEGMLDYEKLIQKSEPLRDIGRGNDDLFGIFYTGGTTGFPKGVMLSHRNFYSSSLAMMGELNVSSINTRYLHAAPMFHIADSAISMANTIAGSVHIFIPAFSPASVVEAIKEHKVTDVLLVPTMIAMLLEQGVIVESEVRSLQKIIYGASPMPEGTLRYALEAFPGVSFFQAYGQTELAPVITILPPKYHVFEGAFAGKLRSAGRASVIVEVKIVDSDGSQQPAGKVGEVLVSGPNAMLGYWNNPEQTELTLRDGWVHTGDAGYLDDEGFLFLVDRVKDMIVTGGENVYSAEVEHAISQHRAVQEVAVIGIPSSRWGESVHAIVRLVSGESVGEGELIEICRKSIAKYKCPQSVEFRMEPFPLTAVGKISKKDLRKPYWDGEGRSIN